MELILKYFPDLTETQIEQFAKLYDLYVDWNSKINVISRKDIEELMNKRVYLNLYVKTARKWRDKDKYLEELGFKNDR